MCFSKLFGSVFLALALLGPSAGWGQEICQVQFTLQAGKEIGTVAKGDLLSGRINFIVNKKMRLDYETWSYFVDGLVSLSDPEGGQVTGEAHILHVVRSEVTWDYISIVARNVGGDLGGETRYFDPMVFTLADAPKTLGSFDLPTNPEEWDSLAETRKFQFHTPDGNQIFHGLVTELSGSCSAG